MKELKNQVKYLFVNENYRGMKIGALHVRMEKYFISNKTLRYKER